MPIFKKLILKEWFKAFFFSTLILFLLITVSNLISGFLRSSVTPKEVLRNYFLDLPLWLGKTLPISCLMAGLFSFNRLKSRNELMAIFASGLSRRRFILIVSQASCFIMLLQFANLAYWAPYMQKVRQSWMPDSGSKFKNSKGVGLKTSTLESGKIWYKSSDYYFAFSGYDKQKNEIKDVALYYFNQFYKTEKIIEAQKAVYLDQTNWLFIDGVLYSDLDKLKFPHIETFQEKTLALHEEANDFKQIDSDISTLKIEALFQFINRIKKSGINTSEYEILFYDKISSSIICVIFALLSTFVILTPNRRNSSFGKNVIHILLFSIIYWFFYSSSLTLGTNGKIPPLVATFSIPFLFFLYVTAIFYNHRKLK